MWLIIGLGNPGRTYASTRHNIGFRVIDRLSRVLSIPLEKKKFFATWGKGTWENQAVILAKPQTFMNVSGEAVRGLVNFFRIGREKIIVIHDDIDLGFAYIRVREKGGDGGHRGIKSIIDALESKEFTRVRIGISRPGQKGDEKEYVLGAFDEEQKQLLPVLIDTAGEAVATIISEGVAIAMNRFNRRKAIQ
ncbi:MAG: aminoacyl-tRNA hydrolase [Deltaproteobacteria bacterium]|nr:aminoacyl-tRNA hydrolase [Deltaproteobacteria bacterium]